MNDVRPLQISCSDQLQTPDESFGSSGGRRERELALEREKIFWIENNAESERSRLFGDVWERTTERAGVCLFVGVQRE